MILKSAEINKIKLNTFILLYGSNEGLKKEILEQLLKNQKNILFYETKEILDNQDKFLENNLTNSLFENEKIIVIKRGTDKLLNLIQIISEKNLSGLSIIINSENLEKKSKLRGFFEKSKKYICIPFYPDNDFTLLELANNFLKKSKIRISKENINFIINKSNGDRANLKHNLTKLELFSKNKKHITQDSLYKLINLTEEKSIAVLVDNFLAKNHKKTINILNENNYKNDDCIIIIRTLLSKLKKILILAQEYNKNKNLELTISLSKPPIFWKDKELVKKQLLEWQPENIKKLIYKTNNLELLIKKNLGDTIKIVFDFLIYSSNKANNYSS